jgi:hypothetical protein
MGFIKSYTEFVNENLSGQYSYYGAGSLFPIVNKLASEGKTPQQIYLYLTTLGIDEERKIKVMSKIFLGESLNFENFRRVYENGLYEGDDILNADVKDLAKGLSPEKAKPDLDVKAALDKLKSGETKPDDSEPEEGESTKIEALQSVLKDAQKLEQIKKILAESLEFDIEGIESDVLESVLDYHKVLEKLTAAERKKLKDEDFIFPDTRSWPIHDEKRAKTALIWATWPQYKEIKKQIVTAVLKRYPQLDGFGAAK